MPLRLDCKPDCIKQPHRICMLYSSGAAVCFSFLNTALLVFRLLQTDSSADQLPGCRQTLRVPSSGLQNAMCAQDQENGQIRIPAKRSCATLHFRDFLSALSDGISEFSLRHPHLFAVCRQILNQGCDQFLLLFCLYKLRHCVSLLSYQTEDLT